MEPTHRQQLHDDLKRSFRGELLLDEWPRRLYATDASLFEIEPLAVACPVDEADLQVVVAYASEHHLPIIARGGGTGLAGESLGNGIVIDCSRHFRSILEVSEESIRLQPGVTAKQVQQALAPLGRRLGPDPATYVNCTVGGMLATNASGSRAALHGTMRDALAALRVVWDSGEAANLGPGLPFDGSPRTIDILIGMSELLKENADLIDSMRRDVPFDRCGYSLDGLRRDGQIDLGRLLVGSEGTLGIFTEATLHTIPLPVARGGMLVVCDTLDQAWDACDIVRVTCPAACDLLDRRLIALARQRVPELARSLPAEAEAILVVEYECDHAASARDRLRDVAKRLTGGPLPAARHAFTASDDATLETFWAVRDSAVPGLYQMTRGRRPIAFVEDIGLNPAKLRAFFSELRELFRGFDLTASYLVHALTGQVHARPFLDMDDAADRETLWPVADAVHQLVLAHGGTISTQHGLGIARTPWVEKQVGALYPLFQEVKRIFDPHGILNPGKIVGPNPDLPAWPLRKALNRFSETHGSDVTLTHSEKKRPTTKIAMPLAELEAQVAGCNGCGACRAEASAARMCPAFHADAAEENSPRAKANLLRTILTQDDPLRISSEEVRRVADLCINCRMCGIECPGKVPIPRLMLAAKAANQAEHGLERGNWSSARVETFAALGGNFPFVSNTLLGSTIGRWVLEKAFGLSRKRLIPRFATRSFIKRARRRGLTRTGRSAAGGRKVAYFVDVFANYLDPSLAESAVAVLQHHGVEVVVPDYQRGSGMAALAQGDLEAARETLHHNLARFVELVRGGYDIVCSEPSAALFWREDAPLLSDDPDVAYVSERTYELTEYLAQLHADGKLRRDLEPIDIAIGHHVPCHVKALERGVFGPSLLGLIPGVRVRTIDAGCSGMAGSWGLQSRHFEASLRAGRSMLDELNRPSILFGSTECGSCRMQMEQGSGKRTLHPVQYLAMSYGLVPDIARQLERALDV